MSGGYAVLWREADPQVFAGELEFEDERLRLQGASRLGIPETFELAYGEIASVHFGRAHDERIDGRSSLVIEPRSGERVLVTSATGLGLTHEIADRLGRMLAPRNRQ